MPEPADAGESCFPGKQEHQTDRRPGGNRTDWVEQQFDERASIEGVYGGEYEEASSDEYLPLRV